ncbi:sensor histidine kinase [Aminobacter carboxidus]|uniref:histidine kinase n=1 Tax=Aminobacter carboxidus TaxID=376165 RepID=A0ABR9GPZ6_9HYPH|nr:sensor histidine kinase [Aminobacter carboxidus]MBE1205756.1 sensor histidine kinase N-terminal domain-containing protein [Aminobacter carboxidus]
MPRTRLYSLRRRLLLWLLVPLVTIGLIALADTYREAVDTANAVSDRVLAGSALAIAERVVVAEDGALEVDIPYVALEMLTSAAQDRVFYRVDGPDGFITGYQTLPVIEGLDQEESGYADASFRGEPIRLTSLSRAASTGATSIPFVVTIAETTIARTQLAQTILLRSALRLAILIGSAAAIVWFAVTFSLRPLYRLRDAIAERNPDDLHPIEQSVPKEVRGLVDTVNSFMGRLGSALGAMRHFTGNASHQLRTPLTIIRTQLALASRAHSLEEARRAARIGDEAVAHAERVIAQLLLLAKVDEAATDRLKNLGAVDLTELARQLTADRVTQAHAAGIDLGFEGEEALYLRGEPMLLSEMIRNLIENALSYAGSGAEATVKVLDGGTDVVLEVEDTGPGIPASELESVRQRFVRGREGDKPGAGLGLPIVEEIASLFGGRLELLPGADGRGLRVRVAFGKAEG